MNSSNYGQTSRAVALVDVLPDDMLVKVFEYLDIKELFMVGQTSTRARAAALHVLRYKKESHFHVQHGFYVSDTYIGCDECGVRCGDTPTICLRQCCVGSFLCLNCIDTLICGWCNKDSDMIYL